MPANVLPLSSVGRKDVATVGAKAARLGHLARGGLPVPFGFCVTTDAWRLHLEKNALAPRIQARLAGLDPGDVAQLERAGEEVRGWIVSAPPPPELAWEILASYLALGENEPVAVRASPTDEDAARSGRSGAYASFTDVMGADRVLERIRDCWASLFVPQVLIARGRAGLPLEAASLGCLVQRMLAVATAGRLRTADPDTGLRDRIVVDGIQTAGGAAGAPSGRWVLQKSDGAVLASAEAGAGSPPASEAPPYLRGVLDLALAVERHMGVPMEARWAVADGKTHLIEAREMTDLRDEPLPLARARRPLLAFTQRVREVMPDPLSPLAGDLFARSILPAVAEGLSHGGLLPAAVAADLAASVRMVRGRLYLDLGLLTREIVPGLDELGLLELIERGKAPPMTAVRPRVALSLALRAPRASWRLGRALLSLDRMARAAAADLERLFPPLDREDLRVASFDRLQAILRLSPTGDFRRAFSAATLPDALARVLTPLLDAALARMIARWAPEPGASPRTLLPSPGGEAGLSRRQSMWELAQSARRVPGVVAALTGDAEGALSELSEIPEARGWLSGFERFLARLGDEAAGAYEIARPRWRERPAVPLAGVGAYLAAGAEEEPRRSEERRAAEREATRRRLLSRMRLRPDRRLAFTLVLRSLSNATSAGATARAGALRVLGLLRRAAMELGSRLAQEERLPRADDVFYLTLAELAEPAGGDLAARVAERRAATARFERASPPRLLDADLREVL